MVDITQRAVLVQLSISQWTARRFDKAVTADVARRNGVAESTGRYNKSLLPSSSALDDVHKSSSAIRQWVYSQTLPWGLEGQQILPTANYMSFMSELDMKRSVWDSLVQQFIAYYPALVRQAQADLGPLFNADDYPSEMALRHKFKIDLAVLPVPSAADFRVDLSAEAIQHLQNDITERVKAGQALAVREIWQRLYDRVEKMVERLSDADAKFRDSLVDNIKDLLEMLPRLNLTDDPELERMRALVEQKLVCDPQTLRDYPGIRQAVASDAQSILDAMGAFMTGSN